MITLTWLHPHMITWTWLHVMWLHWHGYIVICLHWHDYYILPESMFRLSFTEVLYSFSFSPSAKHSTSSLKRNNISLLAAQIFPLTYLTWFSLHQRNNIIRFIVSAYKLMWCHCQRPNSQRHQVHNQTIIDKLKTINTEHMLLNKIKKKLGTFINMVHSLEFSGRLF